MLVQFLVVGKQGRARFDHVDGVQHRVYSAFGVVVVVVNGRGQRVKAVGVADVA